VGDSLRESRSLKERPSPFAEWAGRHTACGDGQFLTKLTATFGESRPPEMTPTFSPTRNDTDILRLSATGNTSHERVKIESLNVPVLSANDFSSMPIARKTLKYMLDMRLSSFRQ